MSLYVQDLLTRVRLVGTDEFGRGLGEIAQKVRQTNEQFKQGNMTQEQFVDTMKGLNEASRTYGAEALSLRRVYNLNRMEWRMQNAALLEGMRVFRDLASIGNTIRSVFETWTLMQIRYENQLENVREAETDVFKIQQIRARIIKEFGDQSYYAQQATDALNQAQDRLAAETRQLTQIEDQNRWGLFGMGLSLLNVGAQIVDCIYHISVFRRLLSMGATDAAGFTGALDAIKIAAGGAGAKVGALFGGGMPTAGIGAGLGGGALSTIGAAIPPIIAGVAAAGSLYYWMTATPAERAAEQVRLREGGGAEYAQQFLPVGLREQMADRGITMNIDIGTINTDADYQRLLDMVGRDLADLTRETK